MATSYIQTNLQTSVRFMQIHTTFTMHDFSFQVPLLHDRSANEKLLHYSAYRIVLCFSRSILQIHERMGMLAGVYIDLDVFDPDRVGRKKRKEGFELSCRCNVWRCAKITSTTMTTSTRSFRE
jgi:hypothetical protein